MVIILPLSSTYSEYTALRSKQAVIAHLVENDLVIFATLNACLIMWARILPLLYCVLEKMGVMLAVTA